jgi:hypothetical protein
MPTDITKLPLGGPAWLRATADDKEEMSDALGHIDAECERQEKREIQGLRDAANRMERLEKALVAADHDIREHLQVARYNLTGMMHTGDQCPIPNPPLLIHAEGIAKSDGVRAQIRAALSA